MLSLNPTGLDHPQAGQADQTGQTSQTGSWARVLRFGAPLMVLAAAVLLLVGVANVEVARGRNAVERELTRAQAAGAQIPVQLEAGDTAALGAQLTTLDRSSAAAHRGSDGFLWAVAGHANLNGGSLRAIRHDAGSSATLAAAAGPLRRSLAPLEPSDQAAGSDQDPAQDADQLGRLDDLARGLSRYATAAIRVHDPSAPALERAALAAGLLPTLAGGEQPRTWRVCHTRTGPCTDVTLSAGRLRPAARAEPDSKPHDLLVTGADPDDVFGPARGRPDRRWDVPTVFGLLYHLGEASITMHSPVAVEQQAIDQLTGERS